MLYSIISELSITEDDVTSNHSKHYNHWNFNRDNDENSDAESSKALISLNKDLKEILCFTSVIQLFNASSIYNCSEASWQLTRTTSLMSSSLSVIAAEAVHNNDLLDLSAERPIKTDDKELYVNYNNCEGLDNKLNTGQMLFFSS